MLYLTLDIEPKILSMDLDHAVCILIKVAKRRKKSYKDSFPKAIW